MIEVTIESLLVLLAISDGRRAVSKTNQVNIVARKVSMIGARLGAEFPELGAMLGAGS
jgi:hypothetical protein